MHIEQELPMNDSLQQVLPYMQGVTTFLSNTGAYETLKSRGLETIRNDSIRLKISLYYDFEHEKIYANERQHYEHHNNYLKPAMMKYFDLTDYRLRPLDFDALLTDFDFKQNILWAHRTDAYMYELYLNLQQKAESLINDLEEEIERL